VPDTRFDLTGKVALVTGGSRGLGREMVLAFAQHGADVAIASRKLEVCEAVAREVRAQFGREALPLATNVSDWTQCDRLADAVQERLGRIDVLVNNAGLSPLYPRPRNPQPAVVHANCRRSSDQRRTSTRGAWRRSWPGPSD
jgi:NAD(P)-dependent dehydrogenase (short-subunit alcohol dehydrogenase family)